MIAKLCDIFDAEIHLSSQVPGDSKSEPETEIYINFADVISTSISQNDNSKIRMSPKTQRNAKYPAQASFLKVGLFDLSRLFCQPAEPRRRLEPQNFQRTSKNAPSQGSSVLWCEECRLLKNETREDR